MKVKDLLSDESKWTHHAFARTEQGLPCSASSPKAVSFCLFSAISACYKEVKESHRVQSLVKNKLRKSILQYNDEHGRTFRQIKKLIDDLDI